MLMFDVTWTAMRSFTEPIKHRGEVCEHIRVRAKNPNTLMKRVHRENIKMGGGTIRHVDIMELKQPSRRTRHGK